MARKRKERQRDGGASRKVAESFGIALGKRSRHGIVATAITATKMLLPIGVLSVLGCSLFLGSGTDPDDMSAENHRRHSQEHAAKGRDHRNRYDPTTGVEAGPDRSSTQGRWRGDYDYRVSDDYYWGGNSYNPSERHLTHSRTHETLAKAHREAAEALEQFEEGQCGSFPPETRGLCPLLGQLIYAEDIQGGVRVRFGQDVDVNAAVAHMRCHLAFARSRHRVEMNSCPLYLEGVQVFRVGSSPEVDFLAGEQGEIRTLRKRMRVHLASEGK